MDEKTKKAAQKMYNGYSVTNREFFFYNPSSLVSFLENFKIESYWSTEGHIDFLKNAFKNPVVLHHFLLFLNDTSLSIAMKNLDFKFEEFENLRNALVIDSKATELNPVVFLRFLLAAGYISIDKEPNRARGFRFLRIPNDEVKKYIEKHLNLYIESLFKNTFKEDMRVVEQLKVLPEKDNSLELGILFTALFYHYPQFTGNSIAGVQENEDLAYCIILGLTTKLRWKYLMTEKYSCVVTRNHKDELGQMGVVLVTPSNVGVVIKLNFIKSSQDAQDQAKDYELAFESDRRVTKAVFVGINCFENRTFQVKREYLDNVTEQSKSVT